MKKTVSLYLISMTISMFVLSQTKQTQQRMQSLIEENMQFAVQQYKVLEQNTPDSMMPKTFEKNAMQTSNTKWWCSGFFPGTLWYIYEYTKNEEIR